RVAGGDPRFWARHDPIPIGTRLTRQSSAKTTALRGSGVSMSSGIASQADDQLLYVGMDVGSTTVKAVVIDPKTKKTLWKDYQRHETRQPEKVIEFLVAIGHAFPDRRREDFRVYVTGSGSGPLAAPIGATFVQEVNAVTFAVEDLHPDV